MAGTAPNDDTLDYVYVYDVNNNQWDNLPPPGQYRGTLQIINGKVTVIGGVDNTTNKITNKVMTFNNNSWTTLYPTMIKGRSKPGAVTHLDNVIVAGGRLDDDTDSDDIEILNYHQPSHWVMARMKLPVAMWAPSLTISDDILYIVGYSEVRSRTNTAYQIPINSITSTTQLTSNQTAHWTELTPAPHCNTAIVANSCPPVIVGGSIQYIPTTDITVLDVPNNAWMKIASLSTARVSTAVIPINDDSILVIGGSTGGRGVEEAKAHSISTVEKGTIRLCHTQ